MAPQIKLIDRSVVPYSEALEEQRKLFEELVGRPKGVTEAQVKKGDLRTEESGVQAEVGAGWLILCEHPHVYTLGKSGRAENLLVDEQTLKQQGVEVHRVERGGDVTYHGPGQIVGYPVLDLGAIGMGLREYIEALEQSVMETVAEFGIEAGRVAGKTGVWIGGRTEEQKGGTMLALPAEKEVRRASDDGRSEETPTAIGPKQTDEPASSKMTGCETCDEAERRAYSNAECNEAVETGRKICAIGVRASRGVVMHGFALNVATDLDWFGKINPCGFVGGAVTSIEKETGRRTEVCEVKRVLCGRLAENLKIRIII